MKRAEDTPNRNYRFKDLLDVPALQALTDSFSQLTGIPAAILDREGEILVASGWQRICTEFHRNHPVTAKRCLQENP